MPKSGTNGPEYDSLFGPEQAVDGRCGAYRGGKHCHNVRLVTWNSRKSDNKSDKTHKYHKCDVADRYNARRTHVTTKVMRDVDADVGVGSPNEKGKPSESWRRKAAGLRKTGFGFLCQPATEMKGPRRP